MDSAQAEFDAINLSNEGDEYLIQRKYVEPKAEYIDACEFAGDVVNPLFLSTVIEKITLSRRVYSEIKEGKKDTVKGFLHKYIRCYTYFNFIKSLMYCNDQMKYEEQELDKIENCVYEIYEQIVTQSSNINEKNDGLSVLHELFNFQNQLIYFYCYINDLAHYQCSDPKDSYLTLLKQNGDPDEFIQYLIETNINYRIIMSDLSFSLIDVLKYLIECKAEINDRDESKNKTALHFAVEQNTLETVQYLLDFKADIGATCAAGNTVLHYAVILNTFTVIEYLLEKGCHVNAVNAANESVLHFAVRRNTLDVVKCLVRNGANVNAIDNKGNTVLHIACERNTLDVVKYLLEERCHVNAVNVKSESVLHFAVKRNILDVVKYLVEGGANLNAIDDNGNTVLHIACEGNTLAVVEYLIHEGINIYAENNNKETVLDIAEKSNNEDVKTYLMNIGVSATEKEITGATELKSVVSISTLSKKCNRINYIWRLSLHTTEFQ